MDNESFIKFLETRGQSYVWQFTKQETDFDKIFLAAKLFNEWKNSSQSVSSEDFFTLQHEKYGITDRHRTLIIAQMYGLITKNYSTYTKEELTSIFKELNYCTDTNIYKKLVTEQFLKIKLPAVTVSRSSDSTISRHIFPVIFIYQVLKKLKRLKIASIPIKEFYSYVLTANFHSDLDRVITSLTQPIRPVVSEQTLRLFKDRSRIVPLLKNLNLFIIDAEKISINPTYENDMDNFLSSHLSQFMSEDLTNDEVYKHFLYEKQNFGLNLIDENTNIIISDSCEDLKADAEYTEDVVTKDIDTSFSLPTDLPSKKPQLIISGEKNVIKRDSSVGILAIIKSAYKCEFDEGHTTFISRRNKKPYMEAHHLIPISQAQYIWEKKHVNVDCIENIVSLCPTCHRAIHHGEFDTKLAILKKLYDKRHQDLLKIGLDISFETLLKFYL